MITAQPASNGHRAFPTPGSLENPAEAIPPDLPPNQANTSPFPASAYHVPPEIYAPKAHAYRQGVDLGGPHLSGPLPERCQFMFSDGRQCTMARSDIHPSLCVYHSEREEQLFGDPFAESHVRGRAYDLPELFSASRDLTTAAGVNRALAQVFRLLAQRRISRQEAATFAKLGHLLLQSIRAARGEALDASLSDDLRGGVILSERSERRISPRSSSEQDFPPSRFNQASAPSPSPTPLNSSTPIAASPEPPAHRVAMSNSRKTTTYAPSVCNSPVIDDPIRIVVPSEQREPRDLSFAAEATPGGHSSANSLRINTSETPELDQNQHLHEKHCAAQLAPPGAETGRTDEVKHCLGSPTRSASAPVLADGPELYEGKTFHRA